MQSSARRILITLVCLTIALPVAAVCTLMLLGLWRWIEATTGIESIGHSGPAGWCYVAVYAIIAVLSIAVGVRAGVHSDRGAA
jgi:hypothetical protein